MKMATFLRNSAITLTLFLVLVFAFLGYSAVVTFSNWPWTKTGTFTSGALMGFEIGSSKLQCFQNAIALEREGRTQSLSLLDAEPTTYARKFKGTDLTDVDFGAARVSDFWKVGLAGENAWLLLFFEDEVLARIERKDYRGPTE